MLDPSQRGLSRFQFLFLLSVLTFSAVFISYDLVIDYREGASWAHLFTEVLVGVGTACAAVVLLRKGFDSERSLQIALGDQAKLKSDLSIWVNQTKKYVEGLSLAIDEQLIRWGLTAAEMEVARLLLKGLSLKEIAEVRNTAEKTARTQSVAIYQKSGLNGRSELSAYFLEDLLGPTSSASGQHDIDPSR